MQMPLLRCSDERREEMGWNPKLGWGFLLLLIWLRWVLVATQEIFHLSCSCELLIVVVNSELQYAGSSSLTRD